MLNKKSYIITPLLILAFVIITVSFSFFINKDVNNNKISLELLINRLRFENEIEQQVFLGNLTGIILNLSQSSFNTSNLKQRTTEVLLLKYGNDFGISLDEINGTILLKANFTQKNNKWKSVNIPEQTRYISKSLFFPFSSLVNASNSFDLNFFKNCLKPCNISNYEDKINYCLTELETEKILYKYSFSDKPFDSGIINLSIAVYFKDDNLTRLFPHQIQEDKWTLINCS